MTTRNKILKKEKPLYLVVGKSATGKDDFVDRMCVRYSMTKARSFTTRAPRSPNDGTHNFISKLEFLGMLSHNDFIASTVFDNEYYGATREQLKQADFYIVDPNGLKNIIDSVDDSIYYRTVRLIYLIESIETRLMRLAHRPGANELTISDRIKVDWDRFDRNPDIAEVLNSSRWERKYKMCWSVYSWCEQYNLICSKHDTFEDLMKPHEVDEIALN